jgi:hypothetical protein
MAAGLERTHAEFVSQTTGLLIVGIAPLSHWGGQAWSKL